MTYVNLYNHDATRLDEFRRDFLTNGGLHELRQFQAFTKDTLLTVTVVVEGPHEAVLITRSEFREGSGGWHGWHHNLAADCAFDSLNAAVAYVFGDKTITPRGVDYFNNVREAYHAEDKRRLRDAPESATPEKFKEGDIFA